MASSNEISLNDEHDVDMDSGDFTLEHIYKNLLTLKAERADEIKALINIVRNNEVKTLGPDVTPEEIQRKRLKYVQSMNKFVAQEQPKDLPILSMPDYYTAALKELEDEVVAIKELHEVTDQEIAELQSDIAHLEKKKAAYEQMKEQAMNTAESETITKYDAEMNLVKRMFQDVKQDLVFVVDTLFPDNVGFQQLLQVLTRALSKGGDDLYIPVTPENMIFVAFMKEADLIDFHPHDENKIKLKYL